MRIFISLSLIDLQYLGFDFRTNVVAMLEGIDFSQTLLNGVLSFLLFASALPLKIEDLRENWVPIRIFAAYGIGQLWRKSQHWPSRFKARFT